MKKKLTVSILGLSMVWAVSAQQSYLAPLVEESMLLDVATANQTVVVGERGHVLVGDANSLTQVSVPTMVTLTAVDGFKDTYLAVGHDATILRSTDGGQSWNVVFSAVELDRPFLDVLFLDESEAIAVGGYGLFFRSTDAGETWALEQYVSLLSEDDNEYLESIADDPEFYQEELNFIFPHFNRLSQRGGSLYLVGEAGLIAKSNDKGYSWERYEVDYQGSFFDVQLLNNGSELAVGLRGNMFLQKEGQDWVRLPTCLTTSLNSIVRAGDAVYAVGNNGVVLAVELDKVESDETKTPNAEGCRQHVSLSQVATDISSTISNAFLLNNVLTAVSANGLQPVE
ncbi:WD40/YVTN/BNR-like repeat-containing protein [Glaciecola sp. SC05]|uniref:WD40/YVTN/BNR-like repeat-containing protein n=1 Tax=Glaciecola sp. SC05 TaxID=1987355 RepID=UPI00352970C1